MITKRHIVNLNLYTKRGTRYAPTTLSEQPPAQPCEMSSKELAYRMKWLAVEMDTVGSAMVRAGQEMEGFDLQDAAGALRASIKDKT